MNAVVQTAVNKLVVISDIDLPRGAKKFPAEQETYFRRAVSVLELHRPEGGILPVLTYDSNTIFVRRLKNHFGPSMEIESSDQLEYCTAANRLEQEVLDWIREYLTDRHFGPPSFLVPLCVARQLTEALMCRLRLPKRRFSSTERLFVCGC